MNSNPNVRWTNPKMLSHLQKIGFELKAKRPIYSIGQATNRLPENGEIIMIRKGSGNEPNVYRGFNTRGAPEKGNGQREQGLNPLAIFQDPTAIPLWVFQARVAAPTADRARSKTDEEDLRVYVRKCRTKVTLTVKAFTRLKIAISWTR